MKNPKNKWFGWIGDIINDTLKKTSSDGKVRWAWDKLTMLASFMIANGMAIWDFIQNGFKFEVFVAYLSVATTAKIASAISNKLKPKSDNYEQIEHEGQELH